MRIWDVYPSLLFRKHLLGEHRELHAIWTILTQNKKGYSNHPETKRWVGKLQALYERHNSLVQEIEKRGFKHTSWLDKLLATGTGEQHTYLHTVEEQRKILRKKHCSCLV